MKICGICSNAFDEYAYQVAVPELAASFDCVDCAEVARRRARRPPPPDLAPAMLELAQEHGQADDGAAVPHADT